jgi:probable F420-dependent oxidoreductase
VAATTGDDNAADTVGHMQRPFRFGVQASTVSSGSEWVALARKVEQLGYATLTMPDHFTEQLAPVPALMAAADATERLRVGALVWDNDYKHPVVFAKEMATMDLLSDGRLELGIGAGWMISDYEQSGIPYDTAKVRIDRFVEGVAIIKAAFADGPVNHAGTHYTVTGYEGLPKPVQRPWPPILIGGGGKRVLSIAAREADIVGINPTMNAGVIGPEAIESMTPTAVDAKVAIVREAAGDRWGDIELNVRVFVTNFTDNRAAALQGIAGAMGSTPEAVAETPFALIGSPTQMVEDLLARRERWGFSYAIVGAEDVDNFAPVVAELAGR